MDENSMIVPRLAPIPVRPVQPRKGIRRITQNARDRYEASTLMVTKRWVATADSAARDQRLIKEGEYFSVWSVSSERREGQVVHSRELTRESRFVLNRLKFLVEKVCQSLETESGSVVVDELAQTMRRIATPLIWDVAVDLRLADESLAEISYKDGSGIELLREARAWADAPEGAIELRARALYAIEALGLIYGSTIERQVEVRLGDNSFASVQLEDAITWFKCYAEVVKETQAARELPASPRKWQFWK